MKRAQPENITRKKNIAIARPNSTPTHYASASDWSVRCNDYVYMLCGPFMARAAGLIPGPHNLHIGIRRGAGFIQGGRVAKDHPCMQAIGSVYEPNSLVGMLR